MKRAFVLIAVVALVVLANCLANSTISHQSMTKQDESTSKDIGKTDSLLPPAETEPVSETGARRRVK